MGYVSDRLQLGGESGRHGPAGRGIRRQGNCSARGAAEEAQGNPHETVMTAVPLAERGPMGRRDGEGGFRVLDGLEERRKGAVGFRVVEMTILPSIYNSCTFGQQNMIYKQNFFKKK